MRKEPRDADIHRGIRRLNPTLIALLLGLVILALLLIYFATGRNPDQDKLTQNDVATSTQSGATAAEKRCASQATYHLIKRELFRRAAQLRGSDAAAYDRLAAYAVVRMEEPALESENKDTGAVNCSGSLSLDLPPGVAAVGGRRTLVRCRLHRAIGGGRQRHGRPSAQRRCDRHIAGDSHACWAACSPAGEWA